MAKIRFLFYKAAVDGKWLDDAISIYTGIFPCNWGTKGYSHVEVWFPDEEGRFEAWKFDVMAESVKTDKTHKALLGQCFSSTTRGDAKGVRFAPASEVLRHAERWRYIEADVSQAKYDKMYSKAQGEVGKPYDYLGLFTGFFLMAAFLQNDLKRYCSDICAWIAWIGGILGKRLWIVSPRRLAKILAKKYHEQKELV